MRTILRHDVPLGIDPHAAVFFITLNCRRRGANQLALPDVANKLFASVDHRQQTHIWWCDLMLLMPDHLHAILMFPRHSQSMAQRIESWKSWLQNGIHIPWQRGFFDHRIRNDSNRNAKAQYILENPIRRGLVTTRTQWRYVWFAHGPRPYGWPAGKLPTPQG